MARRQVWVVIDTGSGDDEFPLAVCSSHEQAVGVAASLTEPGQMASAMPEPVELWEPDDGVPPYVTLYTCAIYEEFGYGPGDMESGRPPGRRAHFQRSVSIYAADRAPGPEVSANEGRHVWAQDFPTAEEAERAAITCYRQAGGTV